jgi:hypothetical protein
MNSRLLTALTLPLAFGLAACGETPVAPQAGPEQVMLQQGNPKGTGLVLDLVGQVDLPLSLGGTVTIDQAVITNLAVERIAGQIVGLQVTGTLSGTAVDVLGNTVGLTAQPFVADLMVTSSGPGQCGLVTLDLSSIDLGVLGIVNAHVPAKVEVKGSGAVGVLLCNLGSILSGLTGGLLGNGVDGIVNAINNQI